MDKALQLKIKFDNQEITTAEEAKPFLDNSDLFQKLLFDFEFNILNLLWRLTQLSEIPFSWQYEKVKDWRNSLAKRTFTGYGFSLNGKNEYLLPCYNGMIASIMIKLHYHAYEEINESINWILKYQNVKRNEICDWKEAGIKKYGGCMKSTPCYIGLVKSIIALSDYKKSDSYIKNDVLESKLENGLSYILNQNIFQKHSDNKPITKDILKITYPFTWKTNIIEILRLLRSNQKNTDSRCNYAKDYLLGKQKKGAYWQTQYVNILKNETWIPFDTIRENGEWISYEIQKIIDGYLQNKNAP